ncbi:MAG: hypothetical protein V4691_01205 [Pseudomonadota bacterium]
MGTISSNWVFVGGGTDLDGRVEPDGSSRADYLFARAVKQGISDKYKMEFYLISNGEKRTGIQPGDKRLENLTQAKMQKYFFGKGSPPKVEMVDDNGSDEKISGKFTTKTACSNSNYERSIDFITELRLSGSKAYLSKFHQENLGF